MGRAPPGGEARPALGRGVGGATLRIQPLSPILGPSRDSSLEAELSLLWGTPQLTAAGDSSAAGGRFGRAWDETVFTVGPHNFSWTPFPPAPSGGGGPGRSYKLLLRTRGRPGAPARSPQRCPEPEPLGTPCAREQLQEAAPTLRSCPMCQADFAPGLAQLDIDGHLAQCLAESTEDTVW
ncbi:Fanconi anemia core complex-associated protein 20 [Suricata suricatta]|uniref:Fanconi anemia core complex-associated protein 20 n=1 Tax=Suricata suricatta TaxID=37032 RepID=UPI001155C4D4|nr:Fanconi anemia core complex-associated protein 20 [Suricata suricatta]